MNPSYAALCRRIEAAAHAAGRRVRLLAVSKTQPAKAIRDLAALGQRAFGENHVYEALAKQRELAALNPTYLELEWHLIGTLQSNKCREAALHFDWLHSLDRQKLIEPLNRHRLPSAAPLNVLIQVNIDAEASKSGCTPQAITELAAAVALAPRLALRGLMAIPAPHTDPTRRRAAFRRMQELFTQLQADFPAVDTLSLGMSDDFELAIAEGATLVRIGTALFGARLQPH